MIIEKHSKLLFLNVVNNFLLEINDIVTIEKYAKDRLD